MAIVSNKAAIAVNQDDLGIQAKKLAANGVVTPRFVGLAPCDAGAEMGYNGVSAASLKWATQPFPANQSALMLVNTRNGGFFKPEATNCGPVERFSATSLYKKQVFCFEFSVHAARESHTEQHLVMFSVGSLQRVEMQAVVQ